jgi:hypothetical protein
VLEHLEDDSAHDQVREQVLALLAEPPMRLGVARTPPADQCRPPGGAAPCAMVVAATVRRPAPGGHNVGMIVMTTMRADLG